MSLSIRFNGDEAFKAAIKDAQSDIRRAVEDVVASTALTIDADVKTAINRGPASGRIYQKYNPRRTHQASAPGQAPMTDTGALVRSIFTDIEGLSATVGATAIYARYLEYGTRRMAPRPVWEPTVERARAAFRSDMETAIRRFLG